MSTDETRAYEPSQHPEEEGTSERERRLDQVIAAYLNALRAGKAGDQSEWLEKHPDLAAELAEYFADRQDLERLAEPVREAVAAGPPIGSKVGYVGDYELLEELGRGGMGVVYKARQVTLKRLVALKMILAGTHASPQDLARFRSETEAVARLQHPHIVQIYEVGEHEGHPYAALEFVAGGSLDKQLDGTPQPPWEAARLVELLARAVHAAHQQGIVHRDLKPGNVLLQEEFLAKAQRAQRKNEGREDTDNTDSTALDVSSSLAPLRSLRLCENLLPKITDFGLAKLVNEEAGQTRSGAILGTPSYMAPEQAAGKVREIGPAADVYALGAILYELLTGRPPFKAETALDTLMQVVAREPVPPSDLQPRIPRDLETICLKCLRKEPGRRYGDANALADDLRRFQDGLPIAARPVGKMERLVKWVKRHPARAGLLATATILLLTLGIGGPLMAIQQSKLHDQSRQRLWQSLLDQARAERLAGNRQRSLDVIQEALKVKDALELRQQAAMTLFTAGVRPVEKLPDGVEFVDEKHHHSGKLPPELQSVGKGMACIGVSADRRIAVLEKDDGKSTVLSSWDMRTGKMIATLGEEVLANQQWCCLSADGRLFAFTVHLWDKKHPRPGTMIKVWDTQSGQLKAELSRILPTGLADGQVQWDNMIAFSPDSSMLAATLDTNGGGPSLRIWDVETATEIATVEDYRLLPGAWSADGKYVRVEKRNVGSDERPAPAFRVTDRPPGYQVTRVIETLDFRPDGKQLVANVTLWDVVRHPGHIRLGTDATELLGECATFAEGNQLWTWSSPFRYRNRPLEIRQVAPQERRFTRAIEDGHDQEMDLLAFSNDGKRLLNFRLESGPTPLFALELWDTHAAKKLADWHKTTPAISDTAGIPRMNLHPVFSPDDQYVALRVSESSKGSAAFVWQVATGEVVHRVSVAPFYKEQNFSSSAGGPVAFSADSRRLFIGLVEGVGVYDVANGRPVGYWRDRGDPKHARELRRTQALAVSSDGRLLASGNSKGVLCLRDAETGRELACWQDPGSLTALTFSPDGKVLASGNSQGVVKLWDVDFLRAELIALGFEW